MLTRGQFLRGSLALVFASTTSGVAFAQQGGIEQAEWSQNYDSVTRMRVKRSNTPTLSPEALHATEQMAERYRDIVDRGGWEPIRAGRMRLGTRDPAVAALRQRLILTGDLDADVGGSTTFDSYVEAGVRRFQARHGLNTTGVLNNSTIAAMNVTAETRLRQLEANIVRLRAYSGNLGHRYVIVNIPAAVVETVQDGHVVTRHAAGVGKIDRQSPIMNKKITEINFNPFWTVPASIIRKDLIPRMQKEPNYLTENKIRIIGPGGQELAPSQVNWFSNEATRYMFKQDPGGDLNSMGFVRINIPNEHGVYMHDTPSRGIFGDDFRFVSSGCVRVQNVRDYIQFLLAENQGWDRMAIDAAFDSGERKDVRLAQPVNVYWTYITAWATPDGVVQFRDDIYKRDGLGNIPMASAADKEPEEAVN